MTNVLVPLTVPAQERPHLSTDKVLYTGRADAYQPYYDDPDKLLMFPPWTVGLAPTHICNQHCFFCSHDIRNRVGLSWSRELADSLFADLEDMGVKGLIYAGGGESLAWPHIVNYVRQQAGKFRIGFNTNGSLLHRLIKANLIEKLFYVEVSIYAHDSETYRAVADADHIRVVTENVLQVMAIKRTSGNATPHVSAKILVNRLTYKQLPAIYEYVESLGVENIFIRCVNNFEPGQDVELTVEEKLELAELIKNDIPISQGYLHTFADSLLRATEAVDPDALSRCWTVYSGHNAIIEPNGDVFICVPWTHDPEVCIGNIKENRFRDIWGSQRHRQVIRTLSDRMKAGCCDAAMCRHMKFNQVMDAYMQGKIEKPPFGEFDRRHAAFL